MLGLISRGERVAAVDLSERGPAETVRLTVVAKGLLTTHVLNVSDRPAVEELPGDAATAPVSRATCKRRQPTVGWDQWTPTVLRRCVSAAAPPSFWRSASSPPGSRSSWAPPCSWVSASRARRPRCPHRGMPRRGRRTPAGVTALAALEQARLPQWMGERSPGLAVGGTNRACPSAPGMGKGSPWLAGPSVWQSRARGDLHRTPAGPRSSISISPTWNTGHRLKRSVVLLGIHQWEGVADALFEELVGELPVGQGAGELQCPGKSTSDRSQ